MFLLFFNAPGASEVVGTTAQWPFFWEGLSASAEAATESGGAGGGGKRYWDWIRGRKSLPAHIAGRVTEDDVAVIRKALRGKVAEAKKKRLPTVLRMAKVIRDAAEVIPPEVKPELEALGVFLQAIDPTALKQALERDRALIEAAYVAVLEEQAARAAALQAEIDADDEEIIELYIEHRRKQIRLAAQATALILSRKR